MGGWSQVQSSNGLFLWVKQHHPLNTPTYSPTRKLHWALECSAFLLGSVTHQSCGVQGLWKGTQRCPVNLRESLVSQGMGQRERWAAYSTIRGQKEPRLCHCEASAPRNQPEVNVAQRTLSTLPRDRHQYWAHMDKKVATSLPRSATGMQYRPQETLPNQRTAQPLPPVYYTTLLQPHATSWRQCQGEILQLTDIFPQRSKFRTEMTRFRFSS
jgi:hypothetical protein